MGPPPARFSNTGDGETGSATPSNNLWIGNLSTSATISDLMEVFSQYGALDATSYSSRSFGFVLFQRPEDAKLARDALQGAIVRGAPIKIDFARPTKPSNHLWVGGISSSTSKQELEEEFMKFGKVEDLKFLRDRNTALIEFSKLEDAAQAMKKMNGKRLGGDQIRVDFLRSQPSRKDPLPEFQGPRDASFQSRTMGQFDTLYGSGRHQHPQLAGERKGDGQPSNVLWVGYPPSVEMDEQMLHNAFILFGEIERITSFPQRHYSFVEFRSVGEACRAKEGLLGRLFNDPRITIMYSSSDIAPGKDHPAFYPDTKGAQPDMVFNDNPFQPTELNIFGHNCPMGPNSFTGPLPPNGIVGANMPIRPFSPHGGFELQRPGAELGDLSSVHGLQDGNPNNLVSSNWRRRSPPAPGMVPSPSSGSGRPGEWDLLDANQLQRDPKRSRLDPSLSINNASLTSNKIDGRGLGLDCSHGLGPLSGGSDPNASLQKGCLRPMGTTVPAGRRPDCIWRGIIAKGGTSVCLARCVPVGKGIGSELPETVNCSARTGLDMLAKHYAEAIGFEICYFLPDSEDDFASYTEFLLYLGGNGRAGVAKLDDGTNLFLVPPSDFLTKVLKVSGPERLYGVVLKLPQLSGNATIEQHAHQSIPSSGYMDRHLISPQAEHGLMGQKKDQALRMEYNRFLHEDSKPPRPSLPPNSGSVAAKPISEGYASSSTAMSQTGIGLTPELIATLATFLPQNTQNSVLGATQLGVGSSTDRPPSHRAAHDDEGLRQVWKHDQEQLNHTGHLLQQSENQYNVQSPHPSQYEPFASVSSRASHSGHLAPVSTRNQDSVNLPHQVAVSNRPLPNFAMPSQNGHHHHSFPHNTKEGYGVVHGADATLYGSSGFQTNNPMPSFNQVHGSNLGQPQAVENPKSTSAIKICIDWSCSGCIRC